MNPCPATFTTGDLLFGKETYENDIAYRKDLAPGTCFWMKGREDDQPHVLYFVCPCGCGQVGACPVHGDGWTWNKNLTAPSLTPSIQMVYKCRWHGYLTDGVFKSV